MEEYRQLAKNLPEDPQVQKQTMFALRKKNVSAKITYAVRQIRKGLIKDSKDIDILAEDIWGRYAPKDEYNQFIESVERFLNMSRKSDINAEKLGKKYDELVQENVEKSAKEARAKAKQEEQAKQTAKPTGTKKAKEVKPVTLEDIAKQADEAIAAFIKCKGGL